MSESFGVITVVGLVATGIFVGGMAVNNQDVEINFPDDLKALARHDVLTANVVGEPVCAALNSQWAAYAKKNGLPEDISFKCEAVQGTQHVKTPAP